MFREEAEPFLIDLSSAPAADDREVRDWAAEQSVFVSSVMDGMRAEREAAASAVEAVGARPVYFEAFGGMDDDPEEAYLGRVAASDIYLGILGARYGRPLKSGYSATHAEYNEASRRGLRLTVWNADDGLDGRQRDFLEEVRVFHTTGTYTTPESLAGGVERRLRVIAAEALAPWIKLGNTVVRATGLEDNGRQITFTARVRDSTVAASIEKRRPDGYGRHTDTRITWPGGSTAVRVTNVTSVTRSSMARIFTVVAERSAENRSSRLGVSFEGRSPEDLTELAMRVGLFGEPNPLGMMSFLAEASNPLPMLETLGLSEDAIERVAELFIAEQLILDLGVDHLTQFRLGPKRSGSRRLRLGWMPSRQYQNIDPTERLIDGEAPTRA